MDFDNVPPVSPQLVEALRKSDVFTMKGLLTSGNLEGVEQLGFIKGVHYALQILENISIAQREQIEEKEVEF